MNRRKGEAILQGFLELVERGGVALWWYNRLKRPFVALDSFNDPYMAQLQQHYHDQQRALWVLVKLGWLPQPLPETQLNPQPMFL